MRRGTCRGSGRQTEGRDTCRKISSCCNAQFSYVLRGNLVSACFFFHSFDSPLLIQVLTLGVHDFDVFAIVSKAAPGARQNAPLVTHSPYLIDSPPYIPEPPGSSYLVNESKYISGTPITPRAFTATGGGPLPSRPDSSQKLLNNLKFEIFPSHQSFTLHL